MYLEKELESLSLWYGVNIWFLPFIFKEVYWNGFLQLADMSHLTDMLFIAQNSAGETENILNIFVTLSSVWGLLLHTVSFNMPNKNPL
jgi:hypothetical protein